MTRARGSLGVPMGPTNSRHSLQGDVLILWVPFWSILTFSGHSHNFGFMDFQLFWTF